MYQILKQHYLKNKKSRLVFLLIASLLYNSHMFTEYQVHFDISPK